MRNNPIVNLFVNTWKYSPRKKKVVVILLLSFLANMVNLLEPVVIGKVFNTVQFDSRDPNFLRYIIENISMLLAITVGFWAFHGTSRVMEQKNAFFVRKNFKTEMFEHVLHLEAEWHKMHHSGDTIDVINKASEGLFYFAGRMFIIVQNIVRLFGSVIALAFFDWHASLLALLMSIFAIYVMIELDRRVRSGYFEIFKSENSLATAIHDYISNIFTIITLKLRGRVVKEIDKRSMSAYPQLEKTVTLNEIKWFIVSFMISLMIVAVLILNAYRSYTASGVIVIGTLFTLYRYLQTVGGTFNDFAFQYGEFVRQDAAFRASGTIEEEYRKVPPETSESMPEQWDNLEVENLIFDYQDIDASRKRKKNRKHDLENVSLKIKRGQRIAFIGESGSGKSTTLAVLRGLYKPERVEVFCDNKVLTFGLQHLYDDTTLIPQDPELFNSTIEDNITMDTSVTGEALDKAIDMSQFRSVLNRLPQGLQTFVMEKGVSLSGGEKQRLALARGILAAQQSEFLFMDEPTSSIDSINELRIYKNIFGEFGGKTIISTIHRLHLLPMFDYIYFFRNGTVFTRGTFDELMEGSEDFRVLWQNYSKTKA